MPVFLVTFPLRAIAIFALIMMEDRTKVNALVPAQF